MKALFLATLDANPIHAPFPPVLLEYRREGGVFSAERVLEPIAGDTGIWYCVESTTPLGLAGAERRSDHAASVGVCRAVRLHGLFEGVPVWRSTDHPRLPFASR